MTSASDRTPLQPVCQEEVSLQSPSPYRTQDPASRPGWGSCLAAPCPFILRLLPPSDPTDKVRDVQNVCDLAQGYQPGKTLGLESTPGSETP